MGERGEVVGSADMSANGGDRQKALEEFGRRKHIAEEGMRRGVAMAATGMVVFARFAHAYIEDRLWEGEYDSLAEALAQPGIRRSEKYTKDMASVYRTLVVERKVPFEELEGVDLRTLQIGLPALKEGKVPWQDILGDAKALGRDDMRRRYQDKRGPDAPLDATEEPPLTPCPMCGSIVKADRIPESEREAA